MLINNLYSKLGLTDKLRQEYYQNLFKSIIDTKTIDEIRESTNKAWVLGNGYFKEQIEKKLNRSCSPKAKGGDRKSEEFKLKSKINRV